MRNLARLFAVVVAFAAIGISSCSKSVDPAPTPVNAPTIAIQEPVFDPETMAISAMIVPSTDTKVWYWKIEGKGESLDFAKATSAAANEVSRIVEYGVEYAIMAYAENDGGSSQVMERRICPMPDAASIAIGEVTLNSQTMMVECTIYPSELTTAWYWQVKDTITTEEVAWTKVEGNDEQEISFAYTYGSNVLLRAYAENAAGRSDEVTEEIYFEPEVATITVSEPLFDEQSMSVSFDVTPSESTTEWSWQMVTDDNTTTIEVFEDNQPRTVSCDVAFDTDYTFVFVAKNAVDKGESVDKSFYVTGPMTSISINSLTAFTIDAAIEMNDHCSRYVAGILLSSSYDKNTFVTQAQSSLHPDPAYPFAAFNSATESRIFTEQDLVRNALIGDEHQSSGIALQQDTSYIIAVYGEDSEGHYDVVTTEFEVPIAVVDGNVELSIELSNISETTAEVDVVAQEECKIIVGLMPYVSSDAESSYDFDTMNESDIATFIAGATMAIPMFYTEPMHIVLSNRLEIDNRYMAYAIAIKDGKVGNVAYADFTTEHPTLTGEAKITGATLLEQTTHETLSVELRADDKATSVRLYAAPSSDHASYADKLDYVLDANDYQNYREEYTLENGVVTANVSIYHPGDNYYLYASAVDSEGRAGEMVCVAMLAGYETEYVTTIQEIADDDNGLFRGTATVKMSVSDISVNEEGVSENVTIRLSEPSSNLKKVWLFRVATTLDDVKEQIVSNFSEYPATIYGSYKEAAIDTDFRYEDHGSGFNSIIESLLLYDQTYGGHIIIAVTLDTSDKLRICECYVAGVGIQNL